MSAKKKIQLCITRKHYELGSRFSEICKTDILYPWAENQKLLSMIVEISGLADGPTVYMSKSSDR